MGLRGVAFVEVSGGVVIGVAVVREREMGPPAAPGSGLPGWERPVLLSNGVPGSLEKSGLEIEIHLLFQFVFNRFPCRSRCMQLDMLTMSRNGRRCLLHLS
jgi:hypothetical protein